MSDKVSSKSSEATALQALLAGPMAADEACERWPTRGSAPFYALMRQGLVEKSGDEFRITEAGRAASPKRNPLLATLPAQPEVFKMGNIEKKAPRISRAQIYQAICDAGDVGISRKALCELGGADSNGGNYVDSHTANLIREPGALVRRVGKGIFVAKSSLGEATSPVDMNGVSLDVDHHDAGDLTPASRAAQMALIGDAGAPRYAVAFASDFHGSVEAAIAQATRDYEGASLAQAIVVSIKPVGRIEVRPVFVPEAV